MLATHRVSSNRNWKQRYISSIRYRDVSWKKTQRARKSVPRVIRTRCRSPSWKAVLGESVWHSSRYLYYIIIIVEQCIEKPVPGDTPPLSFSYNTDTNTRYLTNTVNRSVPVRRKWPDVRVASSRVGYTVRVVQVDTLLVRNVDTVRIHLF